MWFRKWQSKAASGQRETAVGTSKPFAGELIASASLLQEREIQIVGAIDDAMATDVIAKLLYLEMQDKQLPITIHLNSHGGSVTAALAIMDTMEFVDLPVHVVAGETASGMALFLLVAGCPGHRQAGEHSLLQNVPLSFAPSGPTTLEIMVRLKGKLQERLHALTNLSDTEAREIVEYGRTFHPLDALTAGIIDTIAPSPWKPTLGL
jgi:ATP-dependent Clp protease protease subunit